jgi:hypothetical protein
MNRMLMRVLTGLLTVSALTLTLQGCGGAGAGGDPGAKGLPLGASCQSIRGELNRLDSRGVPAYVEKASNGGKLSAAQRSDADNYNRLLGQYLGARCHV